MNGIEYCRDCSEKLNLGAIKCKACGSYQNWKRHYYFWSSFLPLALSVLAIIGYFTLLFKLATPLIHKIEEEINFIDSNEFEISYFNSSDRSVIISGLHVDIDFIKGFEIENEYLYYFELVPINGKDNDLVLNPNDRKTVNYRLQAKNVTKELTTSIDSLISLIESEEKLNFNFNILIFLKDRSGNSYLKDYEIDIENYELKEMLNFCTGMEGTGG